jgi:hypothetical protein
MKPMKQIWRILSTLFDACNTDAYTGNSFVFTFKNTDQSYIIISLLLHMY